jgi:hypothetical protein
MRRYQHPEPWRDEFERCRASKQRFNAKPAFARLRRDRRSTPKSELAGRDSAFTGDTVREMEAVDWASLSDQELLEYRISKLGLWLDGTTLRPLIESSI